MRSWWRSVPETVRLLVAVAAAVALLAAVVWVNFGPGSVDDGGPSPAPTLTMAAPSTGAPGEPSDAPSGGPSDVPSPAGSSTPANPDDPATGDTPGGGLLPSDPADLEALKAELVDVASAGVVAFLEYGAGDATALDRLERLRPFIDDSFYDQLDEGYDDPEFDTAVEEGLWNTAKVETAQVGHNGDEVTPRITDTGVMTVFVDVRQGWLKPGEELDSRVHYLRMFEVSLIDGDEGVRIVDIAPATI